MEISEQGVLEMAWLNHRLVCRLCNGPHATFGQWSHVEAPAKVSPMFTRPSFLTPSISLLFAALFVTSVASASACHAVGDVMTICSADGLQTVLVDPQYAPASDEGTPTDHSNCETGHGKLALTQTASHAAALLAATIAPLPQTPQHSSNVGQNYYSR